MGSGSLLGWDYRSGGVPLGPVVLECRDRHWGDAALDRGDNRLIVFVLFPGARGVRSFQHVIQAAAAATLPRHLERAIRGRRLGL